MIELNHYLVLSAILFSIGVIGVLIRRNAIIIFMSIELMLNAINITFIAFSSFMGDIHGQIFVFMVLTVAAAEAAIGLAIVIALFRNKETINIDEGNKQKILALKDNAFYDKALNKLVFRIYYIENREELISVVNIIKNLLESYSI